MSALSSLWDKLGRSKKYRESFAASVVKRMIPLQIKVLRIQRNWSQAQLATESRLTQGVISRAEDPDYGNLTVNTLVRIGSGFDCAFVGRYVPFSDVARWYADLEDEKTLEVPSFANDTGFIERRGPALDRGNPMQATGTTGIGASGEARAGSVPKPPVYSGSVVVSIRDSGGLNLTASGANATINHV